MLHDVLLQLRLELRTYISMNARLQNSPLCVRGICKCIKCVWVNELSSSLDHVT